MIKMKSFKDKLIEDLTNYPWRIKTKKEMSEDFGEGWKTILGYSLPDTCIGKDLALHPMSDVKYLLEGSIKYFKIGDHSVTLEMLAPNKKNVDALKSKPWRFKTRQELSGCKDKEFYKPLLNNLGKYLNKKEIDLLVTALVESLCDTTYPSTTVRFKDTFYRIEHFTYDPLPEDYYLSKLKGKTFSVGDVIRYNDQTVLLVEWGPKYGHTCKGCFLKDKDCSGILCIDSEIYFKELKRIRYRDYGIMAIQPTIEVFDSIDSKENFIDKFIKFFKKKNKEPIKVDYKLEEIKPLSYNIKE